MPAAGKTELLGEQKEEIYLEFSTTRLAALGLNQQEVMATLASQNAIAPSGVIQAGDERVLVRVGGQFMDAEEADDSLRNGDVYASITVPETFTSDILSMFQGTYSEPTLLYRVNEKDSAVSPKITDQGATTLDTTVNSVFKEMVAEAVTTELSSAGGDLEKSLTDAQEGTGA